MRTKPSVMSKHTKLWTSWLKITLKIKSSSKYSLFSYSQGWCNLNFSRYSPHCDHMSTAHKLWWGSKLWYGPRCNMRTGSWSDNLTSPEAGRIEGPGRKTRFYCANSRPNRSDYHGSNNVSLTVYFISANNTGVSYSNFSSGFTVRYCTSWLICLILWQLHDRRQCRIHICMEIINHLISPST